jgi:Mce-associated membrane protein
LTQATTGKAEPEGSGAADSNTRALIVLALLVVLALGVVVSVVLFTRQDALTDKPFSLSNSGRTVPTDTERHEAVAIAEQFCLRMDGVDGSDVDGYKKRISELLTTKQKAKFTSEFAEFEKLGVDKELKGTGKVLASGLADMDGDSARVLVAHDSTVKASSGTTERHYRWTVDLRKVDGDWLVDDFTPVS